MQIPTGQLPQLKHVSVSSPNTNPIERCQSIASLRSKNLMVYIIAVFLQLFRGLITCVKKFNEILIKKVLKKLDKSEEKLQIYKNTKGIQKKPADDKEKTLVVDNVDIKKYVIISNYIYLQLTEQKAFDGNFFFQTNIFVYNSTDSFSLIPTQKNFLVSTFFNCTNSNWSINPCMGNSFGN